MVTEEAANHGKLGSAGSPGQCLASGAPRSESAGGLRAGSWGRVGSCQFESLNWLGCVVCVSSSAQAARTPPHFTKTTHNTQHTTHYTHYTLHTLHTTHTTHYTLHTLHHTTLSHGAVQSQLTNGERGPKKLRAFPSKLRGSFARLVLLCCQCIVPARLTTVRGAAVPH